MARVSLSLNVYFFVSRCNVCLRKRGEYFINSIRSGLLRGFLVVM